MVITPQRRNGTRSFGTILDGPARESALRSPPIPDHLTGSARDRTSHWWEAYHTSRLTGAGWGDALTHKPRLRTVDEGLAMIDADAFNAFEAAGWDARAVEYDHYWSALTSRLIDPLLDAVGAGPGTRVVDVACGPDFLAGRAAERGAMAVGVDIAEPMIRLAWRRIPRTEFRQGDAQALPFPDRCFDAVVANLGLPHFGRHRRRGVRIAAQGPGLHRYRRPDGRIRAQRRQRGRAVGRLALWHRPDRGSRSRPGDDVVRQIRAGFDRSVEGYRTGATYRLPVSFKLAHARLRCCRPFRTLGDPVVPDKPGPDYVYVYDMRGERWRPMP
jgi:SAM-dependent methyltransferase